MGYFLIKISNLYQKTPSPGGKEKEKISFFLSLSRLTEQLQPTNKSVGYMAMLNSYKPKEVYQH